MQVQNHLLLLHLCEHGIELGIVDDTGGGVGRHTGRVTLDTGDAALLSFDNGFRGHGLVEVQRHEEVHIGLESLQALLVVQGTVDGGNGWHQVRLSIVLDRASDE